MPFVPVDLSLVENQAKATSAQLCEKGGNGKKAEAEAGEREETYAQDGLSSTSTSTSTSTTWTPMFTNECSFDADIFHTVMVNLIKNPNINSSWLFRADILLDRVGSQVSEHSDSAFDSQPHIPQFQGLGITRLLVRKMIPRNELRDKPLEQTCVFYASPTSEPIQRSLIIYLPHVRAEVDVPFYHPAVRGIAFSHDWNQSKAKGVVSTHYLFFDSGPRPDKLTRTAMHLLRVLHKHGEGHVVGYKKRVHHDVLVPQAALQTRYAHLKQKYGRQLVEGWQEVTDPTKHVFEDLCIAAFLIELWREMYEGVDFPGFVDIGCGNGLLVHILNRENYTGWGFDARARKSWTKYSSDVAVRTVSGGVQSQASLKTLVLLPSMTRNEDENNENLDHGQIHDGLFPKGTFIVSNHADELTPWTPILARQSDCSFIMIPCCSHSLTGDRFRAPPPKDKTTSTSTYNSLCAWVAEIAEDCGWEVEREILRIPSTRNTAFIGRRLVNASELDVHPLLYKYGGTKGYHDNVVKLLAATNRGH